MLRIKWHGLQVIQIVYFVGNRGATPIDCAHTFYICMIVHALCSCTQLASLHVGKGHQQRNYAMPKPNQSCRCKAHGVCALKTLVIKVPIHHYTYKDYYPIHSIHDLFVSLG